MIHRDIPEPGERFRGREVDYVGIVQPLMADAIERQGYGFVFIGWTVDGETYSSDSCGGLHVYVKFKRERC
jgi:hypothetical protein